MIVPYTRLINVCRVTNELKSFLLLNQKNRMGYEGGSQMNSYQAYAPDQKQVRLECPRRIMFTSTQCQPQSSYVHTFGR